MVLFIGLHKKDYSYSNKVVFSFHFGDEVLSALDRPDLLGRFVREISVAFFSNSISMIQNGFSFCSV